MAGWASRPESWRFPERTVVPINPAPPKNSGLEFYDMDRCTASDPPSISQRYDRGIRNRPRGNRGAWTIRSRPPCGVVALKQGPAGSIARPSSAARWPPTRAQPATDLPRGEARATGSALKGGRRLGGDSNGRGGIAWRRVDAYGSIHRGAPQTQPPANAEPAVSAGWIYVAGGCSLPRLVVSASVCGVCGLRELGDCCEESC